MSDLISYEAEVQSRTKVTKEKRDGGEYDVIEVKYKSNNKTFTTSVLMSAKEIVNKLRDLKPPTEVALVFEKKGKFNQLVDVLPKGSSIKYKSAPKASGSWTPKAGSSFNSEGMERGNALHCASRVVSALIHKGEVSKDNASSAILSIADAILSKRSEPEKKEEVKEEDFTDVTEELSNSDFDGEELNDEIPF